MSKVHYYVMAFVVGTAGYVWLMYAVGWEAALGLGLVHWGINLERHGDEL